MLDTIFQGIFDSEGTSVIPVGSFMLCIVSALLVGLILSGFYMYKSRYTKSFAATLAMLPAVVCVIIMVVNGNIGTAVAVAGAFSLVRFRSAPGTAKEICAIIIAMGAGLLLGMGYIGYAFLFAIVLGFISMLYDHFEFGADRKAELAKTLRITIPEDLDYTGVFDDLLEEYTTDHELIQVKTTDMGSLYKLTYNLTLQSADEEKEFIDKLRCRNGNLEISMSRQETPSDTQL